MLQIDKQMYKQTEPNLKDTSVSVSIQLEILSWKPLNLQIYYQNFQKKNLSHTLSSSPSTWVQGNVQETLARSLKFKTCKN